jgi:hypothetical protein
MHSKKLDSALAVSLFSVTTTFQLTASRQTKIIKQPMNLRSGFSLATQNVVNQLKAFTYDHLT